jgi:cell shape-determining protein MreC
MLVGKADTVLVEHARVLALDLASPVLEAIARPVAVANRTIADLKEFASLREENARLREENARLLAWQTAARRLENENEGLRGLANFREGPEASFITARIVGDSVSAYVRGALLNVGRKVGAAPGQAVVTGEGLAGRIAEVGDNSARVLFVTDVNSHHHLGPRRQLPGRHPGRRGGRDQRGPRARAPVRRLLAAGVRARRRLRRDRPGERRPQHPVDAVGSGRPEGALMKARHES